MSGHPIRKEPVNVWCAPDGQNGPKWIAKFGLGRNFPIVFWGDTEADVRDKAEAFRDDVVARHEASYLVRIAAIQKSREAKKRRDEK